MTTFYFQYDPNNSNRVVSYSTAAQSPANLTEVSIDVSDGQLAQMKQNYAMKINPNGIDPVGPHLILTQTLALELQDDKANLQALIDNETITAAYVAAVLIKLL